MGGMADQNPPADPSVRRSGRAWVQVVVRWALIVLVLAATGWAVVSQWGDVVETVRHIHPLSLSLSFALLLVGQALGTLSWQQLLDGLGPRVGVIRGSQVFLVGQLGKYVPGSVWAFVLQMELGRRYQLARARVLAASLFAAGIGVVASLILGLAALPLVLGGHREWLNLFFLLPVGLVCLHPKVMTWLARVLFRLLRRPAPNVSLRGQTVARSLGLVLAAYACYGGHLWLLVNSVADVDLRLLLLCAGATGLGMTAGLFAFFLPSGLGVREAVLVAALATAVTTAQATALAVSSRIMFTLADLSMAGLAALTAVVARSREHARTSPGNADSSSEEAAMRPASVEEGDR
jgi:hypothetical protein